MATTKTEKSTHHWSSQRPGSLVGSVADRSLLDATSPTSSITEHSASGVVNVLKIAQDWQQKQREKEQQQQEDTNEALRKSSADVVTEDKNTKNQEQKVNNTRKDINSTDGVPLIVTPQDLLQHYSLSETEIQELFLEMCFYARLGFVQPPCCLMCTYQETMESAVPNKKCPRWVIWRKNAETALHPSKLDGNLLITRCHVAQSLLQGNSVEGHAWDAQNKAVTHSN